jgi:hypothetical protein
MGRSPNFVFNRDVEFPVHRDTAPIISELVPGQQVRLAVDNFFTSSEDDPYVPHFVTRTVSTYNFTPSPVEGVVLVVDNIDCDENFVSRGLRCIAFRDPMIPKHEHIYAWVVTTDGYVRETEHYGISGFISSIVLV